MASKSKNPVTREWASSVTPVMSEVLVTDARVGLPTFEAFDDALVALYADHAKALVEMLWVFVGSRAEAEDLCHDAFVRLHRVWRRIDHGDNVGSYLRTTAFNLARSSLRRRSVVRRLAPPPDRQASPAADENVELRADQRTLLASIRRLPRRQRECIVLRYWQDLTEPQIATTLGISVSSVKTHLRRATQTLEQHLEARP